MTLIDKVRELPIGVVIKDVTIAEGFDSWAGQIRIKVANIDPATRCMLQRNTASIVKNLYIFK